MSVLPPECNQNESPIQFILISSLNTHISRVVKLFAWSLNLKSINLMISAGGFHLRSLLPNPDCTLKCRLITSFQYAWKPCFCHNLEIGHFYYYHLKEENVQEESLHIDTHFFHLYFINKHKRKLIMQVNLCFGVLTASPHNYKTIKCKLQSKTKKNLTLKIAACLLLLSLLY